MTDATPERRGATAVDADTRDWRWLYLLYPCVWLVFLGFPLWQALADHGPRRVVGIGVVLAFAAAYTALFVRLVTTAWRRRDRRATGLLALLTVLSVVMVWWFGLHDTGTIALPYLVAAVLFTFQDRTGTVLSVAALVATVVACALTHSVLANAGMLGVGLFSFALNQLEVQVQGRAARADAAARRAVALAERTRIAGDVHDLVGHSLTVANLKLQLVDRLVDDDPARAHRELADTREIIARALADVRSTVDLERGSGLDDEVAGAVVALRGAGVDVSVVGDPRTVRGPIEFVLGRVVREASTNVLRHRPRQPGGDHRPTGPPVPVRRRRRPAARPPRGQWARHDAGARGGGRRGARRRTGTPGRHGRGGDVAGLRPVRRTRW